MTEAALWASLLAHDLYCDLVFISDDAAQFKLLGFFSCVVLGPYGTAHRAVDSARRRPTHRPRSHSRRDLELLPTTEGLSTVADAATAGTLGTRLRPPILKNTGWSELDEALRTIHAKKSELLLVLEHPEIPLHNNLSENDIRQYVKKREDQRRDAE